MIQEDIKTGERLKNLLLNFTEKERSDLVSKSFIHDLASIRRMIKRKWLMDFYEKVMFGILISKIDEKISGGKKDVVN